MPSYRSRIYLVYSLLIIRLAFSAGCLTAFKGPIAITSESLSNSYAEDEAAADKKYRGVKLRVTGTIESLIVTDKGNQGVSLHGARQLAVLNVLLAVTNAQVVLGLKKGQQVTVEGTGDGLFAAEPNKSLDASRAGDGETS